MVGILPHIVPHGRSGSAAEYLFYEHELALLPEREQMALRLRVGLVDGEQHTLKEVGDQLGVGRERARQIQSAALMACRKQRQFAGGGHQTMRISNWNKLLPEPRVAGRKIQGSARLAQGSDAGGKPVVRALRLDRRGQEQLVDAFSDFFARAEEIEAESAGRMDRRRAPVVNVAVEALAFPLEGAT